MSVVTRILSRKINKFCTNNILIRGAKRWCPDAEFAMEYDKQVMYPDEYFSKFPRYPYNACIRPKEVQVQNMVINFGPAHPAAHGVLRMVTYLQGEVKRIYMF